MEILSNSSDNNLKELMLRLLDQCYSHNQHHLGSAFSSLPIVNEIYQRMDQNDKFILSNGHAATALYVVLEKFRNQDSSQLINDIGVHPKRSEKFGIDCSTGSLGMGITVATGMAQASPGIDVFCLISDGECSEGSVWEALKYVSKNNLTNLHLYFNLNGWAGYDSINVEKLSQEILIFYPKAQIRLTNNYPFEEFGLSAHYFNLSKEKYLEFRERICADYL